MTNITPPPKQKAGQNVLESDFASRISASYKDVPQEWKEKSIDLEREEIKLKLFHKKCLFFISLFFALILFLFFIVFLAMFLYSGTNDIEPFYKLVKDVPYLIAIILALCLAPLTVICSLIRNVFKEKTKEEKEEYDTASNNPLAVLSRTIADMATNKN